MLALIGYTRLPVFYSSDGRKILGCKCRDEKFREYIFGIKDKKVVAIRTLSKLNLRRFVVKEKAINPGLRTTESVVRRIYVYPSYEAEEPLTNVYALGFVLKGIRKQVFVPLIALRYLSEEEVQALHGVVKVKELTINGMIEFVRSLDIQAEVRNLIEGIVVDPIVERYQVLVDEKGRVLDTNVCIEAEIVLLIRQQGNVYIYSRRW